MEDYKEKWHQCQQLMQQQLKDPWLWPTWFQPVTFERYDPQQHTLLLQVPSTYVYEFIEHYYVRLVKWAITEAFGDGVALQYRIRQNDGGRPVDFTLDAAASRTFIKVTDAAGLLKAEMAKRVNGDLQWLPAYDRVARWLTDNKGRGLLCVGTSGLGKSLICRDVLPVILRQRGVLQCQATDMARRIDELLKARCVIIDDLGKEDAKHYGQIDRSLYRLCDAAERQGLLLVITTNLSTTTVPDPRYPDSIEHRYGPEALSRLSTLVTSVLFEGPDLRQ